MKKILAKSCKHEWYYSTTVIFEKEKWEDKVNRVIHHCRKCGQLDIQTIYK